MQISDVLRRFNNPKTLKAVNICLALLLALSGLLLVRDIVSVAARNRVKAATGLPKTVLPARYTLRDYALILASNPFGFPAGELKPITASSPGTGPAVSRTDITLIGTVAGRSDLSYAIMSDKTGLQDVFRIGADVFGLGKLSRIEKTKVFIGTRGKEIEIALKDIADIREIKNPVPRSPLSPASFGKRVGESTYEVDPERIQQAINKPDHILTDARFIPNIVDGKQQGFVLREVRSGGIYSSLGLQNGDILLRINEFTISSPEAALQAFTALRGIDRAQLDIVRNNAPMSMTYQIR
ncbi:MAG: hypothetical protein M0024_04805 [Nitrospiraceae bacterium]|nr:hypothetical protein [Nitrospiraceae bacterium]